MKKRFLLFALLGAGIYITTTSHIPGDSSNMTGSHGGSIGCGSCHGSAATAAITVSVELDSAGTVVTSYKPGMTYKLRLKATNTGTATLPKFGLQLSMVKGTGTASVNAGTLTALTASTNIRTSASIQYLSHFTAISATTGTGTTGTTYVAEATWVAPVAGTGTVKAYGVLNAVNGDNNDGTLDKWNSANASFTEQIASSTSVATVAADKYVVYPNPASGVVKVTGYEGRMQLIDMQGRAVATGNGELDMTTLASGVYMLQYFPGGNAISTRVVKQ